ncbi:MAG TPA: FliH/SctL family protein [Gammaproteobacteria bacterium]|nr:FliH/SctL family protein [Gammaproteobacteria bacterium]
MGMIRRADLEGHTREAYVMDLSDLEKRGNTLVDAANAKATQIVQGALKKREQLLSTATDEGREQGYADGLAQGREQGHADGIEQARAEYCEKLDQLDSTWSEQLAHFEQQRDAMIEAARVQVVELAAKIAQRVVRRVVELDPSVVQHELESVLSTITEPTRLVISVHPDDAELAKRELPRMIERFASCEHAQVVTDPALPRGSCIARTPGGGVIDASLSKQLDRIIDSLLPSGHVPEGAMKLPESHGTTPDQSIPSDDEQDEQEDAA